MPAKTARCLRPGIVLIGTKDHTNGNGRPIDKVLRLSHDSLKKVIFSYGYSDILLAFPGGYSTMEVVTEVATLINTEKMNPARPIILINSKYWSPWMDFLQHMVNLGLVSSALLDNFHVVDTPQQVQEIVVRHFESLGWYYDLNHVSEFDHKRPTADGLAISIRRE